MLVIVIGPNPLADWSKDNCNRQNKKLAPVDIKEAQKYNKGGFTHLV
jgi:hypothetical protein